MNTYTRKAGETMEQKNARSIPEQTGGSFLRVTIQLGCICILFFCAIALRVFLTAKIERMNKHSARLAHRIYEFEIECYHLRNKKARLTSLSYISARTQQYKLGLRSADYRQIQTVALLPGGDMKHNLSASRRNSTYSRNTPRQERNFAQYNERR